MADIERGQRIKARRVELHLTQPAVVDQIEELAKQLPEGHALHPATAQKAPVTLRGLQTWEQGGGIAWEKAKLLAQVLQTDVKAMMQGTPADAPTPDPFAGQDDLADRLDAIEARLERIENMLLGRADSMLDRLEDALNSRVGDAANRLEQSVDEARSILRAASQDPQPTAPKRAPKRTRAA